MAVETDQIDPRALALYREFQEWKRWQAEGPDVVVETRLIARRVGSGIQKPETD